MIIQHIKLKNYRQYRDVTISLGAKVPDKNIIVIEGTTGAGKTTILNALTWCLYGKELHIRKGQEGLPILNTLTCSQLKVGDTTEIEVEIQFVTNDENKKYKIKRTAKVRKTQNGKFEQINDPYFSNQPDGSKLEMFLQEGRDMGYISDPIRAIQRIFPEQIHEYFFFDGERLDDYFSKEAGESIKEAVFRISQLTLLERLVKHLDSTRTELFRHSKDLTPKVEELEEKKLELCNSLDKTNEELKKQIETKKEAERNRKELQKALMNISPEGIKNLTIEREKIEKEISQLEKELKEENKSRTTHLIESAPAIFAFEAIEKTTNILSTRKDAGDIPPNFKRSFLEKLLKEGICICGTDISTENIHRKKIEQLLQNCDEITNISEELIELNGELRRLRENVFHFDETRRKYADKINKIEEQIKEKNVRLSEIGEKIKNVDIEEVRRKEEEYEEFNEEIEKAAQKIGELQSKIEGINAKIKDVELDLKKELEKESKLQKLKKINSFCEQALNIANRVRNEIMDETRSEVEALTKEKFFEIIPKERTYTDIKIDNTYNFLVLDQQGTQALGTLSAGEREVLALSFIGALNIVSGVDVPIVIDTPLARIDTVPRENIAKIIPQHFRNTQVILLVTSAEYTPPIRKALFHSIWREYKLKFKEYDEGSECEVVPYDG